MLRCLSALVVLLLASAVLPAAELQQSVRLRGEVLDADTRKPLPPRVYVLGAAGSRHFAPSQAKDGWAVAERKKGCPKSVERHTTLSALPFHLARPPGRYPIAVERGKEFLPESGAGTVGAEPVKEAFRLK